MTAGIPHDMRRIALVSLVAHVVTLVALTTVPLTKIRSRGGSAIEVLLVSQPSPVQVEQAPVPQPKPVPPSPPAPSKTAPTPPTVAKATRSEEHTSELQSLAYLVCRLLLEKKKIELSHAHDTTCGGL